MEWWFALENKKKYGKVAEGLKAQLLNSIIKCCFKFHTNLYRRYKKPRYCTNFIMRFFPSYTHELFVPCSIEIVVCQGKWFQNVANQQ